MAAVAVVLLIAIVVVVVVLVYVLRWRKKRGEDLQDNIVDGVDGLDNPVYSGK